MCTLEKSTIIDTKRYDRNLNEFYEEVLSTLQNY